MRLRVIGASIVVFTSTMLAGCAWSESEARWYLQNNEAGLQRLVDDFSASPNPPGLWANRDGTYRFQPKIEIVPNLDSFQATRGPGAKWTIIRQNGNVSAPKPIELSGEELAAYAGTSEAHLTRWLSAMTALSIRGLQSGPARRVTITLAERSGLIYDLAPSVTIGSRDVLIRLKGPWYYFLEHLDE